MLASKEKAFFASCKRLKASERNDEYEKVSVTQQTNRQLINYFDLGAKQTLVKIKVVSFFLTTYNK